MKTRTYYIVMTKTQYGDLVWQAYVKNIWNVLFGFSDSGYILGTRTSAGPTDCEVKLRKIVKAKNFRPTIVRVVEI
jgi:hypothetical protein